AVPMKTLKALARKLTDVPANFKLHPRVEKVIADRRAMGEGELPLDWGMGETLAYAALLNQGYGVRLSGQDSARGTFSHRHAVLHDQNREKWAAGNWIPLPHGYEGQGPEHSSARPERYLQLCAEHNMQVAVPTTPAQIFHLLRRQMVRQFRKPLIVMSPKSLLRHKGAVSSLEDLAEGQFQT